MCNIAELAFTNPFTKISDGGKKDIESRIKALLLKNYNVDIYTLNKRNEILNEFNNDRCRLIYDVRKTQFKDLFSIYPISVVNKYSINIENQLIKNSNKYDVIIYEGEHMVKYRYNNKIKGKLNYIRMHDIESDYRYELYKSLFPDIKSYLQLIESLKYKYIEKNITKYFDRFLFISKLEKEKFENIFPDQKQKFIWMPPVVESKSNFNNNANINENNILYFGDLTIHYNLEGVKWFLYNVLPIIKRNVKNLKVNIVGRINKYDKELLEKIDNDINIFGYVDKLDDYISNSKLIIIPILHGAGVKIKLIEALSNGKIVIATNKAVEGTDFINNKHLLIRDNPEQFANACIEAIRYYDKYKVLGENALEHVKNKYSLKYQSDLLEDLIKNDLKALKV